MTLSHTIKTIPDNNYNSSALDKKSRWYQKFWGHCHRLPLLPSDKPYDVTISDQFRFIWFRNYKVGSRSLLKLFSENQVVLDAAQPYQCYYPPKLYRDYFSFAFVRNPWDRLISCWHNKVLKNNHFQFSESEWEKMKDLDNFLDFIQKKKLSGNTDGHIRLQSSLIDLNQIQFLGRFESFQKDAGYIIQKLQFQHRIVPVRNQSERSSTQYQLYYTSENAEKVARLYEKDIRMFGYTF